jgi:hypothetical protein
VTAGQIKRPLSSQVDERIWRALERRWNNGLETKRVHIERALVSYLNEDDFDSPEEYQELAKKYGTNE